MSQTNGAAPLPADTAERYREVRRRNKLLEEEIRAAALEKLHRRTCKPTDTEVTALRRRLQESYGWDWVGAYDEAFDRLTGPDRDLLQPISLYQDRRYGANWPFWRTWLEHARIRAGGRLICTQGTLAPGALKGLTNYVIGEGFTDRAVARRKECPAELIDAVQECLDEFRQHNQWNLQQRELFMMSRRDGEYFLRFAPDDGGMLEVDQILPEQVMEPPSNDPRTTSFGCINELGRLEKIVGYNLCLDGDQSQGMEVSAEEIVHVKINVDRMVKRGLSDFSFDTYDTLRGAQRLLENLSAGSAVQASIALIRQHEQSTQAEVQGFVTANSDFIGPGSSGNYPSGAGGNSGGTTRYQAGRIEDIPKGYTYVAPPFATNAQNFIAVEQAVLRSVAVRWNAPEWLISGDASNNNYASSITAESPFVKSCKGEQAVYHYGFHRTATEAVKVRCDSRMMRCMGRAWDWDEVKRLVEIKTEPPTIEVRNKLQEAQRNQMAIQAGAFSPQMWCQEENVDYEQVVADLEEHQQRTGGQGQALPMPGQAGPAGPVMAHDDQGGDLASMLGEARLEEHLLEAGFTGQTKGRYYVDGKRVPNPNAKKPAAKEPAAPEQVATPTPPEAVPSEKAQRAKAAHKLVDKSVQRYAEEYNEVRFAKAVEGVSHPDSEPMDVTAKSGDLIEMKTMVIGEDEKLTMNSYAQVRKALAEKEAGKPFHTVVSDDRKIYNAKGEGQHGADSDRVYYYRRGIAGSARIAGMYRCTDEEDLKRVMSLPDEELPPAAQRTDQHITGGDWEFFKDEKGKGYKDKKTGKEFRAKK